MHSFQPSRGRIIFEVFCALGISASLAGAWQQTGASALLAGSIAAGLFGLSHAFGTRRGRAMVDEPQRIDFATDERGSIIADLEPAQAMASEAPELAATVDIIEPAPPTPSPKRARKPKAPRKSEGRRSKAAEEAAIGEPSTSAQMGAVMPIVREEEHPRIEPLFEPEPFARQPRAVLFGRKAG